MDNDAITQPEGTRAADQVDEIARTLKEIIDDAQSDKSLAQVDDSDAENEIIEAYQNKLDDEVAAYSRQLPRFYDHL